MAQPKCTFGAQMPINIPVLKDVIAREIKFYRPYTVYRPNFARIPLTAKFYAKHDQYKIVNREQEVHVKNYNHHLTRIKLRGPVCKYSCAATENQEYGWFALRRLVVMDRNDTRFFRPIRESHHTKIRYDILAAEALAQEAKALAQ